MNAEEMLEMSENEEEQMMKHVSEMQVKQMNTKSSSKYLNYKISHLGRSYSFCDDGKPNADGVSCPPPLDVDERKVVSDKVVLL